MTRAIPLASLVLAATAVVLALVPRDAPTPPVAHEERPSPRQDDDLEALKRKVDLIEDDQRAMWSRVLVLEQRAQGLVAAGGDAGVPAGAPALVAEVAQLKQELRSVMQGEVLSDPAGRSAMKDVVREVEADLARERLARRQERQQQRAAEQQAKWKRFAADAKLTFQQEQTLNQRLAAEDAARKALFERGTPPEREDFRALREQRRETDQLMLPMLDEEQQRQYRELRADDTGAGRGGRQDRGEGGQGGAGVEPRPDRGARERSPTAN